MCTGCACEELQAHPEVWFLGHAKSCTTKGCKDLKPAGAGNATAADGAGAANATDAAAGAANATDAAGGAANATDAAGAGGDAEKPANALADWPECECLCYLPPIRALQI